MPAEGTHRDAAPGVMRSPQLFLAELCPEGFVWFWFDWLVFIQEPFRALFYVPVLSCLHSAQDVVLLRGSTCGKAAQHGNVVG